MKNCRLHILFGAALAAACVGFAQEAGPADADSQPISVQVRIVPPETPREELQTITYDYTPREWFGPMVMIVLALLALLCLATAVERAISLRRGRVIPEDLATKAADFWKNKKYSELNSLCAKDNSLFARAIKTLLELRGNTDVALVKSLAMEKLDREMRLQSRRAEVLSTSAAIALLLGLLGTVATLHATAPADFRQALIFTTTGLSIATPALALRFWFRSRIKLFAIQLEEEVASLVHAWFIKKP